MKTKSESMQLKVSDVIVEYINKTRADFFKMTKESLKQYLGENDFEFSDQTFYRGRRHAAKKLGVKLKYLGRVPWNKKPTVPAQTMDRIPEKPLQMPKKEEQPLPLNIINMPAAKQALNILMLAQQLLENCDNDRTMLDQILDMIDRKN